MIGLPRRLQHSVPGYAWSATGTSAVATVKAVMGARLFPEHVATVGYDYDFHPGYDLDMAEGDTIYAPMAGCIIRRHYTHFGWEDAEQLDEWERSALGGSSSVAFARVNDTYLRATLTRAGAGAYPNVDCYVPKYERFAINNGDWEFRVKITPKVLSGGVFGFSIHDSATGQYVGAEYDGTNVTCLGARSGGAVASHGTTGAVTTEPWFRMILTTTTLTWAKSADAETWTTIATEALPTFTNATLQSFVPRLYMRATDTNATPETIDIDGAYWYDGNGIDRFGNFLILANATEKFIIPHFRMFDVNVGDVVRGIKSLGKVGLTGFDAVSGNINFPHVHFEYAPNNNYIYVRTESTNSLDLNIMPRANVSNNVSVVRTTDNDPDGVASWKLAITITRADQDFDMNAISLTGNLATRTVNLNTRAGLNSNLDIPKQSGVYIVPGAFTANSASYTVDYYFNKATVGTTFVSASVADTAGTVLWSE